MSTRRSSWGITTTGVICPNLSIELVSMSKSFGFATRVWAYRNSKHPKSTSIKLLCLFSIPSGVSQRRGLRPTSHIFAIKLKTCLTPRNKTYFNVYCVHLCNRTRSGSVSLIPLPLVLPVPFHILGVCQTIVPPVIGVGLPPSLLAVPQILPVIKILSQLASMPSALSLGLTFRL